MKLADNRHNADGRRLALLDAATRRRLTAKYAAARVVLEAAGRRLPCGHLVDDSMFEFRKAVGFAAGEYALIVGRAVDTGWSRIPPTVWCVDGCGWVKCDNDDEFEVLKGLRR